ncbi:hypothetical protein DJ52_08880, partial [Brachyspira murdochii]
NHKALMQSIINDSNGEDFDLNTIRTISTIKEMYKFASIMYGISDEWNMNEEAKLTYFIFNRDM